MGRSSRKRPGTLAPFLLVALTALLGFFALAVNKAWLISMREELRTAADAAALAAAQELVSDDMLRGSVNRYPDVLDRATTAAATYSQLNTVRSRRVELRENLNDPRASDVLFGVLSTPRARDFVPVAHRSFALSEQGRTNTVVIVGRQSSRRGTAAGLAFGNLFGRTHADVAALSVATLDRGIRGFRPRNEPTPLAPVALLSDPTGDSTRSWEYAVEARNGPNGFKRDLNSAAFVAGAGDGIHEFPVSFAHSADQLAAANSSIIHLGSDQLTVLASLLSSGYGPANLMEFDGKFVLPADSLMTMPGRDQLPSSESAEVQALYLSLEGIRQSGQVRIWPLYQSANSNEVQVSGFVAAHVVSVTRPIQDQPLQFILKPTMIHRSDALTDTDLRGRDATMNNNPYICKIRRVE